MIFHLHSMQWQEQLLCTEDFMYHFMRPVKKLFY